MLFELVWVLQHIKTVIEASQLQELYTSFVNTLQQISSASTPDLQNQLKEYKEKIKSAHEQFAVQNLTHSQRRITDGLGASVVLGQKGFDRFLTALSDNSANTPGATEEINKLKHETDRLLANATNTLSGLGSLVEQQIEIEKDQAIIQLVFDKEVSVDTFVDLATQAREWKDIIHAYSLFADEAPEKTKIIATSKGSPYEVWLVTTKFIGETICATVKPFVELYKSILAAKEHALVLEEMKVGVDGKKFELFKVIDEYQRKRITEIVESVGKINGNKKLADAQKNEAINALGNTGPRLYEFITKGGKVDVSKNEKAQPGESNRFELEPAYQEVRKLEGRVQRLLEAKIEQDKTSTTDKDRQGVLKKRRKRVRRRVIPEIISENVRPASPAKRG